jgi:hypothetical protein
MSVLIGGGEPLAGEGGNIERLENAAGNLRGVDLLRLGEAGDAGRPGSPHSDRLEGAIVRGECEVHRGREAKLIAKLGEPRRARRVEMERDQLLRLRIGQRPQQHAVEHTEDRRIRADADGQRQQHGDREPGRPRQPPAYMPHVHQQRFEPLPLPHLAAPLPEKRHVAEIATGGSLGLLARQALVHEFVDPLVEVLLDGDGDVVVPAISEEEATEP